MLDDDRLAELFGQAAEAFEVPQTGIEEIVARAERGPSREGTGTDGSGDGDAADGAEGLEPADELGRRRRLVALAGRHRILSVAAVLVVVLIVAGTIGALGRSPSNQTVTALRSGNEKGGVASGGAKAPTTSTTLPGTHAGGLGFGASSASGSSAGAPTTSNGLSAGTQTQNAAPLPQGAVGQSAKIEQTGTLDLALKKGALARTMTGLTNLAGAVGGFVANSQSQNGSGGGTAYGTITMEVPVNEFAAVLKSAEHYGKTSNLSTSATDVTGQYVDLQARLSALEDSRQQYLTILAKATSIGDILSVQEQLNVIQQQIEQLQGQLQLLTSQTSYSKVTVTMSEGTPPPRPGPLPESGLVRSWHDSVGGFVAGIEGVVRLAGPFLFALLCLALVAVGGRVLWRRYQRHRL
ncbi:MAG TPA: DUF4349 domain-containing protein [Acidimicrobiales bacterium]|nr:DUF4349 domain-containing protein [Acidimicrobiales bacterium]